MQYPHGVVVAQLWKVQVGRVPLLLLDANLEENAPQDRSITGPLYGGDQEFRVRQGIMLGIGGMHALEAVGLSPTVCHMNEGHSAFLAVERIGRVMRERKGSFAVGAEANSAGNIFTTHTPVPAGNDAFEPQLVRRYLEPYRAALGISETELLSLGRSSPMPGAPFSMPVLAIARPTITTGSASFTGRSRARCARALARAAAARDPHRLHHQRRAHPFVGGDEMGALFTRYLGPRWTEQLDDAELGSAPTTFPTPSSGRCMSTAGSGSVQHARRWLHAAAERRGARPRRNGAADEALDPHALTIGFARRFATYKRAALLFTDLARVKKLLGNTDRPGAARLRRQGPPPGQGRQGAHSLHHPGQPRRRAAWQRGLRGGLRHAYRTRPGERGRRVAQHAPPPPRSQRYQRDEGRRQWSSGAERSRRMVCRGMARPRLGVGWGIGHGEEYADASGDAARRSSSTICWSARWSRSSTRARAPATCRAHGSSG